MLSFIKNWIAGRENSAAKYRERIARGEQGAPPDGASPIEGVSSVTRQHMRMHEGFPLIDWERVKAWVIRRVPKEYQASAWEEAERVWLHSFKSALGPNFRLDESKNAIILSSLELNVARASLAYMEKTLERVAGMLEGVADFSSWGKDLLIVFDDLDGYIRYTSYYLSDVENIGLSGGMHIDAGCSHYATVKEDLRLMEPIIAHEMTHGCLASLPLPTWLNEGLAVNMERHLAGEADYWRRSSISRQEHIEFWDENEIKDFWSGESFLRTDNGGPLSYDFARVLVEQLSTDWGSFKGFIRDANFNDAGAESALRNLGFELGRVVCVLLEKDYSPAWSPAFRSI